MWSSHTLQGTIKFGLLILLMKVLSIHGRSKFEAQMQCIAGCLNEFTKKISQETRVIILNEPGRVASECAKEQRCQTCQQTCVKYFNFADSLEYKSSQCKSFCKKFELDSTICLPTCKSLENLLLSNPGQCPKSDSAAEKPCEQVRRLCKVGDDRLCVGTHVQRCCRSTCGDVCINSNVSMQGLPEIPPAPLLFDLYAQSNEQTNDNEVVAINCPNSAMGFRVSKSLNAKWDNYAINSLDDPIIFLLQKRSYIGYIFHPEEMESQDWVSIAYTSKLQIPLSVLKVGYWFQFRLAAFSNRGTRGYSNASCAVQFKKKPRRPTPPSNFRDEIVRLHKSIVDVQLRWEPPTQSDLPITKYSLTWTKQFTLGNSNAESLTKHSVVVVPVKTEYYLSNLEPNTTYKVLLSAISNYGDVELKSYTASLYIRTPVIPNSKTITYSKGILQDLKSPSSECMCAEKSEDAVITKKPFWKNDQLKIAVVWNQPSQENPWRTTKVSSLANSEYINTFKLEWGEKVCIDSDNKEMISGHQTSKKVMVVHNNNEHIISGLRFNCHYVLRLNGLSEAGESMVYLSTCFCTPPCKETLILKESSVPVCPIEAGVHQPRPPLNVNFNILKHDKDLPAYKVDITWAAPNIIYAISGFRLTWGQRVEEDVPITSYGQTGLFPQIDPLTANVQIVESGKRSLVLHNLSPAKIFVVQVETLTVFGNSPKREIFFQTPGTVNKHYSQAPYVQPTNNANRGQFLFQPASNVTQIVLLLLTILYRWLNALT